jgi:hypothetical protein
MSLPAPSLPDPNHSPPETAMASHRCGNCDTVLTGPYCSGCGQHAHASARSLTAVLHDGWHDLTHVDGRLWHTLWLLFSRPGRLTEDFFQERRARYLPPVRLYLVLSLVFFSLAASTGEFSSSSEPAGTRHNPDIPCEKLILIDHPSFAHISHDACVRFVKMGSDNFVKTMTHNIPRMMFVFLPLMAGVVALLYWRPRRYYVEHLVFLLHNHSVLFLGFVAQALIETLAHLWRPLAMLGSITGFALFLYVLWYPYAAMRRYYGQGRTLTGAKYLFIGLAYGLCLVITFVGTAVITTFNE